ncbi:MAG: dephospho-CoA kinase [Candidatus Omnitrophota bacterium]
MPKQSKFKEKIVLGLTGIFGSGKSTVAELFRSEGALVIDADKLAHRCLKPETKTYKKIIRLFGKSILKQNKTINRSKLAGVVFNNKKLLGALNNIIHPQVIREIKSKINSARKRIIVLDAPLLIEAGLKKIVDKLIVVTISRQKQVQRLKGRGFLKKIDILKRAKLQMPLNKKVRLADFIIDNNGVFSETRKQASRIRRILWKS